MTAGSVKVRLQELLGIPAAERVQHIGPKTRAAFARLETEPNGNPWPPAAGIVHVVQASSFADPADVRSFQRCKATGKSDQECFKAGDNGIGCWGDDTTAAAPMCALPPDDMLARFGGKGVETATAIAKARHARVIVEANGRSVVCLLADRMPWRKNVKNGAGIDLNPAAAAALDLRPPFLVTATWAWG